MKPVFAIDVGGVLASKQHDGQPREGAVTALAQLHQDFDLWVVSQCGKNRALKTKEWIKQWGFPIPEEKQVYVPFGAKKVPVLKQIEAVYFVDDRFKHVLPAFGVQSLKQIFHMPESGWDDIVLPLDHRYVLVRGWNEVMQSIAKE